MIFWNIWWQNCVIVTDEMNGFDKQVNYNNWWNECNRQTSQLVWHTCVIVIEGIYTWMEIIFLCSALE